MQRDECYSQFHPANDAASRGKGSPRFAASRWPQRVDHHIAASRLLSRATRKTQAAENPPQRSESSERGLQGRQKGHETGQKRFFN
mmetsp:Transcript_73333/g.122479  ORF Transcript_73333/g.122479 Transcript_73333/m.122479 type:complete len:86 (+) Transcript_73333:1114-1371(+)